LLDKRGNNKMMPLTIALPHNYSPRNYQMPFLNAVDSGILRALCIWHRRAGKDCTFINLMARKAFERVGNYQYFLPTATMARKIVWEGINDDGFKFIDYLPPEIIARKSERDMLITLVNNSTIQLIGTDNLSIVGTNPVGTIFSEYSLQKRGHTFSLFSVETAGGHFLMVRLVGITICISF